MHLLRLSLRYARPYRWWILGVFVFQLASTLAALMLPSMNAEIIDRGVALGDTDFIWATGVNMLLICLAQLVTAVVGVVLGSRAAMAVGRDLRRAVFAKVDQLSVLELGRFGPATLITRSTNDIQQVQILVLMTLNLMVATPIMCVGGVIMALREDMSMSWLVWSSVLLLTIVVSWLVYLLLPMFREMQDRIDQINGVLREQIIGVRTLRAFVREAYESDRYRAINLGLTRVSVRVGNVFVLMFPTIMMILHLATAAVLWFGGHQVDAGTMQVGSLTAFLQYLLQILIAVMMGVFMVMMIPRAAVAAERIDEVLQVPMSGNAAPASGAAMPENNRVVFDGVHFGYSGAAEQVIRGVTFTAEPGQMTAIVGATGSGKSSLINLLAGFYQPDRGELSLGGTPIAALNRAQLSQAVGLVPQRPFLFSGTVASNLRFGRPEATDDELWEVLRIAQAEDFVRAMPGELEATIAQGGTNVSGGQRQRICIARAIIARPKVFLLDDSFSALDVATDARLRAALLESIAARDENVTTIVVAQRIATIIAADRIVVLDRGAVIGVGTHEELVSDCEIYRAIVDSQFDLPIADVTVEGGQNV